MQIQNLRYFHYYYYWFPEYKFLAFTVNETIVYPEIEIKYLQNGLETYFKKENNANSEI
jgi:hypothetical protein